LVWAEPDGDSPSDEDADVDADADGLSAELSAELRDLQDEAVDDKAETEAAEGKTKTKGEEEDDEEEDTEQEDVEEADEDSDSEVVIINPDGSETTVKTASLPVLSPSEEEKADAKLVASVADDQRCEDAMLRRQVRFSTVMKRGVCYLDAGMIVFD